MMEIAVSTCLLDFVDDPENTTIGGSGEIGDDMTIISGPRHARKAVLGCVI